MAKARRRADPADPIWEAHRARQSEKRPENWGVGLANLSLAANGDVDASLDFKGNVRRALRMDVFSLLYYRRGGSLASQSYDAVRRLQKDIAILHATQGSSEAIRTTASATYFFTEGLSLGRADAGARVQRVLDGMPARSRVVMRSLCEPEVVRGEVVDWHGVVARVTGEANRHKRGEIVREACDDLAASYRDLDNRPR